MKYDELFHGIFMSQTLMERVKYLTMAKCSRLMGRYLMLHIIRKCTVKHFKYVITYIYNWIPQHEPLIDYGSIKL